MPQFNNLSDLPCLEELDLPGFDQAGTAGPHNQPYSHELATLKGNSPQDLNPSQKLLYPKNDMPVTHVIGCFSENLKRHKRITHTKKKKIDYLERTKRFYTSRCITEAPSNNSSCVETWLPCTAQYPRPTRHFQ